MFDPAGKWKVKSEDRFPAWHTPQRNSFRIARHRKQAFVLMSVILCFIYWQFSYIHTNAVPSEVLSGRSAPESPHAGHDHPPIPEIADEVHRTENQRPIMGEESGEKEEEDEIPSVIRSTDKAVELPAATQVQPSASPSSIPDEVDVLEDEVVTDDGESSRTEYTAAFPDPAKTVELLSKAATFPEIIHVPFEAAIADEKLEGWEDQWVANAEYDLKRWGTFSEPKIDFIYLWVNGSEDAFKKTMLPYEENSTLNDAEGTWLEAHRTNRYRDWDELRYSIRSIEKHAVKFRNKIQILVNAVKDTAAGKQVPSWLQDPKDVVQVLSQEDIFDQEKAGCLPTFNSLTIENQLYNTPSNTDRFFALSDDMLLGKPHAASDIYSPLFGPTMGFKTNAYSTRLPPTAEDAKRFGEKPFLIYTSWLLNRRFGERKRKGQVHFGHSLSRSVYREAITSFPRPELESSCQRFRGESGFQLYSWYVSFHYIMERHREALLWSYIMLRSDRDQDENFSWEERKVIMEELKEGMANEEKTSYRKRNFYHVAQHLQAVGLEAPMVNTDIQWTSLDGPAAVRDIECMDFNVDQCLAPGFSTASSDAKYRNPVFSTTTIFDRLSRADPKCGDCVIKLLLNRVRKGLSPMLPHSDSQEEKRQMAIKAIMRYKYTIVEPDALFVMITDAEQAQNVLLERLTKKSKRVGQLCLNDDVTTTDEDELTDLRNVIHKLYNIMFPQASPYE